MYKLSAKAKYKNYAGLPVMTCAGHPVPFEKIIASQELDAIYKHLINSLEKK
jgi:hypothetical protein